MMKFEIVAVCILVRITVVLMCYHYTKAAKNWLPREATILHITPEGLYV